MSKVPASLLTSTGLIGGFAAARASKHRYWGGVVAGAAGLGAVERCRRNAGLGTAFVLGATYAGALAVSHPLARKIGAWPAVFTVTAVTAAAAHFFDRNSSKVTPPTA